MTVTAIKTNVEEVNSNFIKENQSEWKAIGSDLKAKRESLGISIKELSEVTGTGETRLRNFEKGEPISMAKHLQKVYELAFFNVRLRAMNNHLNQENNNLSSKNAHEQIKGMQSRLNVYELFIMENSLERFFMKSLESNLIRNNQINVIFESDDTRKQMVLEMAKELNMRSVVEYIS